MKSTDLRNMRMKQIAFTNGLILTALIIYFVIISNITFSFAHFFLVLGVLQIILGVLGLMKGESTKSIFPIFEQVAIYEKQKMGSEWSKLRRVGYVWNLILGCLLFLLSFLNRNSPDQVLRIELMFMVMIVFFLLVMINIGMIIHFRKVDRSTSELDMKGYTWKSNLVAVVIGIVFGIVMVRGTLYYVFQEVNF
ncbi:hypothetical protein [Cytobacillus dafuensis]|uniref:Uncharacterized protein n=1 Tax=Cytobacillus dafuensis TaxID=1742359 RepID=A0A5B8Z225_CYTDA|nr:hypothetical protein [Cytobacillus dafuensis]QED46847.1 hypothetical protein FSZ17_05910 [Cytobacillus dafuensis]